MATSKEICCCGIHIKSGAQIVGILHIFQAVSVFLGSISGAVTLNTSSLSGLLICGLQCIVAFMVISGVNHNREDRLLPAIILEITTCAILGFLTIFYTVCTILAAFHSSTELAVWIVLLVFVMVTLAVDIWFATILLKCRTFIKDSKKSSIGINIASLSV
ncbi:hypothetical protein QR680_006653 [Steinernema hermaphroditum]|uniref:Uncharacterized protein n=1 Tax=Steinernema hermaphroditum TaxID=289476 RepID=A0AA39HYB5_9BILA|nr:hypothetical protein QR680_006653 [Steinernema hermaphroditum]